MRIYTFLNEGVECSEVTASAFGTHQVMFDELTALVVAHLEKMVESSGWKRCPIYRGDLQRPLVLGPYKVQWASTRLCIESGRLSPVPSRALRNNCSRKEDYRLPVQATIRERRSLVSMNSPMSAIESCIPERTQINGDDGR